MINQGAGNRPITPNNNMTTTTFNKNYYAKVYGVDENGKRLNALVSLTVFRRLFGEFADKFLQKFDACGLDRKEFRLRSKSYKVTIYVR